MNVQYITDERCHKNAVQLPMQDWEQIQKDLEDLEDLERLRNKKLFLSELTEAVEEVNLVKQGKLKARDAKDLLNRL